MSPIGFSLSVEGLGWEADCDGTRVSQPAEWMRVGDSEKELGGEPFVQLRASLFAAHLVAQPLKRTVFGEALAERLAEAWEVELTHGLGRHALLGKRAKAPLQSSVDLLLYEGLGNRELEL